MAVLNSEKMKLADRILRGEISIKDAARSSGHGEASIYSWVSLHKKGLFEGREHLRSVARCYNNVKPRAKSISDMVGLLKAKQEAPKVDGLESRIAELEAAVKFLLSQQ